MGGGALLAIGSAVGGTVSSVGGELGAAIETVIEIVIVPIVSPMSSATLHNLLLGTRTAHRCPAPLLPPPCSQAGPERDPPPFLSDAVSRLSPCTSSVYLLCFRVR